MITNIRYFGWLVFMTSCYVAKVGLNLMTILPQPQVVGLKMYTSTLGLVLLCIFEFCYIFAWIHK